MPNSHRLVLGRSDQELVDLFRSILPPPVVTNYRVRIVELFVEIREHLGVDVAKELFKEVAAPSKRQQKFLQEKLLRLIYEEFRSKGLTLDEAAQRLYGEYRKDGHPVFGASPEAIRKHLLRIQRELSELREKMAHRLYEKFKGDEHPEPLEAIRKRLLRIESKLAESGNPAAAELIRRFLTQ